jgi:diaminopimelate decarboxylase
LVRAAHDVFRHEERPPKALIFEPGRFVVEDSALGLCSVVRTKTVGERRHVIVDLSTNLLIPLPLARFELVMPPQSGETFPTTICDGTCSPAGVFVRDVQAPRIAEGSRLALANCGAYTAALAEPFMEPPAPVLWCDSDGVHALVDREQMRAATDLVQGFESSVPSGVPSNSFEGAQE